MALSGGSCDAPTRGMVLISGSSNGGGGCGGIGVEWSGEQEPGGEVVVVVVV